MSERNLYEVTGDIKDINTLLVSREEWNRRAQPQQASDLVERCREILAWKETGLLAGNALRSFAKAKWGDDHMALSLAEADTMKEALEILVSQPAQAGQVLSDAEIDALYAKSDLDADPGSDYGCGFYSGARWAEQAVRAKMGVGVPMTDPQLQTSEERRATGDRILELIEKQHPGIVGEKGGA